MLRETAYVCEAEISVDLTSTSLHKHIATFSQGLNQTDSDT